MDRRFFVEAETVHMAEDDEVRASLPSFGTSVEEGSFAVHTKGGLDDRTYFLATTRWGKKLEEFTAITEYFCDYTFPGDVWVFYDYQHQCLLSVPVHWWSVIQEEVLNCFFQSPTVETSFVPMFLD